MVSKNPEAPVCPKCGRSNGVQCESTATMVWWYGAWRWTSRPDPSLGVCNWLCQNCDYPD